MIRLDFPADHAGLPGVVVAVSGGPDSVALLRALAADPPLGPRVVAHFNHRLRGPAADADAGFVAALAASLGWGFAVGHADLPVAGNLEANARRARYDFLAGVARDVGAGRVATGHTADDQAETVLHRLLRGTGLAGLRGIAATRPLAEGVALVRPLLGVTRGDVLAYLAALGQPYCYDATNDDRRLTRNRIRHELLPLLARDYNPAVAQLLVGLAGEATEAFAAREDSAASLLLAAEREREGPTLVFDRRTLRAASPLVRADALRMAWRREGWRLDGVGRAAWARVMAVIDGGPAGVDLPGPVRVRRRGHTLRAGPT